jgi:CspA family cold shock protein
MDSMSIGKIKMFNDEKGFGFIRPDDGRNDVVFHVSSLREGDDVVVGKAVTSETGVDPKSGKTKAVSVDLV